MATGSLPLLITIVFRVIVFARLNKSTQERLGNKPICAT
jgi:hypothetical protein